MPAPRTGRASRVRPVAAAFPLALTLLVFAAPPARARLDLDDRGPILRAGDFNLRVSNAGILGNPFPERSFDPSFEYPKGTGQELMHYAALWVGALDRNGQAHVSGGPLLEWRPSTAPGDTVIEVWHGRIGSARGVDDDGDGRSDEERANQHDDDGDGQVDEDLGVIGQQMLSAEYRDDRPEAVTYLYPGYERHTPIGVSVQQEVYAWSWPGYRGVAGLQYVIRNETVETLRDVYVGLYVDLDVRPHPDPTGSPADSIEWITASHTAFKGVYALDRTELDTLFCFTRLRQTVPVVKDRSGSTILPMAAVVPLEHSTDTLGFAYGRPPGNRNEFRVSVFSPDRPSEAGGPPRIDEERYLALAGQWPQSEDIFRGDHQVLVSCGPFPELRPGQTIRFAAALAAAPERDGMRLALARALVLHEGTELNLLPDNQGPRREHYTSGDTGINGHEACIEPPPGVTFTADPDCAHGIRAAEPVIPAPQTYVPGRCIWTDADCDKCTGINGRETVVRWLDPHVLPPPPSFRVIPGDHSVRIEWDNMPEILVRAREAGPAFGQFMGYNVYKLADWRDRGSLMPPDDNWAIVASYGYDQEGGRQLLSAITDSTLDYTRIWYEQPLYPVGRYAIVDHDVLNGFDYVYVVTAVVEVRTQWPTFTAVDRYESPIGGAQFSARVTPRSEAREDAARVWVVPNPFRGRADWDRPTTYGDPLSRHLDFMGLPRAPCTIQVWTVAGDLVATIDHDGSGGDGQASWDLVSRNGQEVVSGIYVFTVDSPLGRSTGRFVVIR